METFGYYGRYWSSQAPHSFSAYVLQWLPTLVAPIFIAATIYVTLSRIIRSLDASEFAAMSPRASTALFICSDVVLFCVQMAGGGLQITTSASVQQTGVKLVIGGLVLQMLVFCVFIFVTWRFFSKLSAASRRFDGKYERLNDVHWRVHLWVLLGASACILLRNLIRVIESAQGFDGPVLAHEAYVYVFDAAMMLIVVWAYVLVHPGLLLRKARQWAKAETCGTPVAQRAALGPSMTERAV